ncbi:MAG: hypothetical protein GF353_23590 [Candidatus Lokiarchaeota archaeon]|nr:hypothetical protein [Candidatus Lokiarchaeota archaeon]
MWYWYLEPIWVFALIFGIVYWLLKKFDPYPPTNWGEAAIIAMVILFAWYFILTLISIWLYSPNDKANLPPSSR